MNYVFRLSAISACAVTLLIVAGCQTAKPELHAKGVAFTDSLYGSSVVRMTDKTVDNYSGDGIENEYAKADYWNSDGTRIILRSNDRRNGDATVFDPHRARKDCHRAPDRGGQAD